MTKNEEMNMCHKERMLIVMVLLTLVISGCAPKTTPTPAPTVERVPTWTPLPFTGRLVIDKLTSKALEGNLMGNPTEREFLVYLPPDYETSGKRYPVVYVLHGSGVGDDWLFNPMKNAMRELLKNGEANDMIFVFPDGTNKLMCSLYMSSITNGDFETYITKELVDEVDSNYRTIPNRDSRALMGCSMGGLGSLHLALKYPDEYGVVIPMNGLQMFEPIFDSSWKEELSNYRTDYSDWSELAASGVVFISSVALIASPNPNNPPFYFDWPYKINNGKLVIDQEVYEKIEKLTVTNDIEAYLAQPIPLKNL
jgi:predicted esterase